MILWVYFMKSTMRDKFFKSNKLNKKNSTTEINPMIVAKKIIRKF